MASEIDVYTYVIKTILRGAGLNPDKDVVWVVGGNQQRRLAAMTGGNIDAGFFSPPSDSRLRKAGFNGLAFAPDYVPHLMLSTQVVRRDWAQEQRRYSAPAAARPDGGGEMALRSEKQDKKRLRS